MTKNIMQMKKSVYDGNPFGRCYYSSMWLSTKEVNNRGGEFIAKTVSYSVDFHDGNLNKTLMYPNETGGFTIAQQNMISKSRKGSKWERQLIRQAVWEQRSLLIIRIIGEMPHTIENVRAAIKTYEFKIGMERIHKRMSEI